MTTVMFRGGGVPSGVPAFSGPATFICDASEWNPSINDAVYLAWSRAIIIRAMYGDQHDDAAWYGGARRDALHAGGAQFVGIYQYIAAAQDAAAQAHALVQLLGPLRPGEIPIADLEEGAGDQSGRWEAWQDVIAAAYPQLRLFPDPGPWLYSGLDFAAASGLHPQWVAAYQANEPATPHLLWQFSSSYPVPGVGVADCSIYHGSVAQLRARITPAKPKPAQEDAVYLSPIELPPFAAGKTASVTADLSSAGTFKAIGFSSDWSVSGGVQPQIRVAVHSLSKGFTQIETVTLPKAGKAVVTFTEHDVDYLSLMRANASDAAVSAGT